MAENEDSERLKSQEASLNDSADKNAVLWTSLITLGTYLLIATGSVTHRDLFLNSAIKLPVLGVDLPVTGYFFVAPIIFLIFHFYTLLQFEGLSEKVADHNLVLHEIVKVESDRRIVRRRLSNFPFLQFLVGVHEGQIGIVGRLQILISWITVVMFPVVVMLQFQIAFLPYHSAPITWLHRICLVGDLALIWFFWRLFLRVNERNRRQRAFLILAEGTGTVLLLTFSLLLATYPGEALYRNPGSRIVDRLVSFFFADPAVTASRYLFEGDVNGVTGQPGSLFANRIILPGEHIYDETKKIEVSASLRGRDLRGAVLPRADLRLVDFTGATLEDASFAGAKLQGARFGCAGKVLIDASGRLRKRTRADSCDNEQAANLLGADFSEAILHGTFFNYAKLRGARFARSLMQGLSADKADLTGATFTFARLEGSSLENADMTGASLFGAQMQGANLQGAILADATFLEAQLQGANLDGANLTNAQMPRTNLYRAVIDIKEQKATVFSSVQAKPTFPVLLYPPRGRRKNAPLQADLSDPIGYKALLQRAQEGIQDEEVKQTVATRLRSLDPEVSISSDQFVSDAPLTSSKQSHDAIHGKFVEDSAKLICDQNGAPYVARNLIFNGRILGMELASAEISDDPAIRLIANIQTGLCRGAIGLDVNDFRELNRIERLIIGMKNRRKGTAGDDSDDDADQK
jgi:uncharacterized protein YjbI with pentapeptide repeats